MPSYWKKTVFFVNAATTRVHLDVLSAMIRNFCDEYANPSGAYKTAANAERAVNRARIQAAGLIGARPNEIYFTSGGSESDNWAIK